MEQLNVRHLYYFWVISREGSIAKASELLDLAPQTLSGKLMNWFTVNNVRMSLVPQKSVFPWVEQPLNVTTPTLERQFRVAMSGEPVPDRYEYIDTALDPFGPEAYHVFEVPAGEGMAIGNGHERFGSDEVGQPGWRTTMAS